MHAEFSTMRTLADHCARLLREKETLQRRLYAVQELKEAPKCVHFWDDPLSTIKWAVVENRNSHKCTVCDKEFIRGQRQQGFFG
jgi:hypothetical protein